MICEGGSGFVFGVNCRTDDCATPVTAPVTERNRIAGGRGVFGTAEGVAGGVFRGRAGFQATGLGAEHLDDTPGDQTHAQLNSPGLLKVAACHYEHSANDGLKKPCPLTADYDRSNAYIASPTVAKLILPNVCFTPEYGEFKPSGFGIRQETLEARDLDAESPDGFCW